GTSLTGRRAPTCWRAGSLTGQHQRHGGGFFLSSAVGAPVAAGFCARAFGLFLRWEASSMDLFEAASKAEALAKAPLAVRMRPRSLDEFVGQERVVGPGTLLRQMILSDRLVSLILYGPPGTGKTTLARLIADSTRSHFEQLNAVTSGVTEIRKVIQEAKDRRALYGKRSIVF